MMVVRDQEGIQTKHSPPGGGGYIPLTMKMMCPKKAFKLKQPKFKNVTMKGLEEYNKDFKYWWIHLTRNICNTRETIGHTLTVFQLESSHSSKQKDIIVETLKHWQSGN
jgi:hypothetical protein